MVGDNDRRSAVSSRLGGCGTLQGPVVSLTTAKNKLVPGTLYNCIPDCSWKHPLFKATKDNGCGKMLHELPEVSRQSISEEAAN